MRKALHMLGILDELDIEWIAKHGIISTLKAGEVLIREKQTIAGVYFVLDGQLTVFVGSHRIEVARLLSGEIVGEISFVDSRPPSASVVAKQDSVVLFLERESLSTKLQGDQAFAARFYRSIASFLAHRLSVTVERLGYGSATQDVDPDELGDSVMEEVSLGAVRFGKLLQQLRDHRPRAVS